MNSQDIRRDPERWCRLQELVFQGASLNEIRRTLGVDHRTVRRHWPDYKPFPQGGGGEANEIRKANQTMSKMDNYGNVRGKR